MNFHVPHYIPPFIWRFWLSAPHNRQHTHGPRVHIYDADSSDLQETTSIPDLGHNRPVFQDIGYAFSPNSRAAYDQAERAFLVLQSQAEEALHKLIDVLYPSTSSSPNITTRIPISPEDLSAIIKFFVFLRFRNGPHYQEIVQELMEPTDFYLSTNAQTSHGAGTRGKMMLSVYSPPVRQIRLQTVLTILNSFFHTPTKDMTSSGRSDSTSMVSLFPIPFYLLNPLSDHSSIWKDSCLRALNKHCWQYSRETEVYLGIAGEKDREFILPECCFGVLDESFGGAVTESESFDCFFPILPTLALYILRDEDKVLDGVPSFIQVGTELEQDIHLRNAMVLSSVRLIQKTSEIFIHHRDLKTPVIELDQIIWTSTETSKGDPATMQDSGQESGGEGSIPAPSDILEQLVTEMDAVSASANVDGDSGPTGTISEFSGPKIIFSSLSSIVQSISSYNQFRCNHIDYSRLKQRCRQKFDVERMQKMWKLKRDIVLSDLTDEVEVIGEHAVAFGAFSDVWMGRWFDIVERKQRVVAIKYLRQVMVQGVREKLLKRLQAELLTWHQLCHRNLATLYGIVQTSTSIGMVSAWCHNGTISSYLKEKPGADRLKLLTQVASGVAYLHHFNPPVVHGDLKGGNILVDGRDQAVITDFGLSKVMEDLSNLSRSSSSTSANGGNPRSTSSSFFAGSTRWMAPELVLALVEDDDDGVGEEKFEDNARPSGVGNEKKPPRVTTFSDVYAFASVCLEIITGQLPYSHRRNDYSVIVDILRGVPPSRGSDLPAALERMFVAHEHTAGVTSPSAGEASRLRDLLERCWDRETVIRPSMEDVLEYLNGLVRV